jgi:cytidyltransferase-like protein
MRNFMKRVFVSGCYDILHAGHVQFFKDARVLGDHLTVCFASDEVLWTHKKRRSSIPQEHKLALLQSLAMVDGVVMGENLELGLDFQDHFLRLRPDILAVTEDDQYGELKRVLCARTGAAYVVLPKTPPKFSPISTTKIVQWIRAPREAPLRVDFAGGWLDVPRFSRAGGLVVNCAISPLVSISAWEYEKRSGLGGSAAWALLHGEDGVDSELNLGVGWQDPAVITETGLCVWKSGLRPALHLKRNGNMLNGLMALFYTDQQHDTPEIAARNRNYQLIHEASLVAGEAVLREDPGRLAEAVGMSYRVQMEEGMKPLPHREECLACKYCGGGWGGYAVYVFQSPNDRNAFVERHAQAKVIEPFVRGYRVS